ncbi:hypothetical protein PHMEG_00034805, partial [Phytophthora megakarya]
PNRARNEQRYELAFLRQKVTQLQQQLHSLQLYRRRNSDDRTDATSSDINCTHPSVNSIQSVIAWKSVAKRQCCRRESSERKNARLKLIVERQWRVATDLNTLLRKRVGFFMAECSLMFPGDAEGRISRVVDFNDDMERFHDLFNRLDEAYHELDAVFAFNGLASMEMSTHDVHVRERAGGKLLEFFANKLLPFSSQNTAVSVWNYFKGDEKHSGNGGLYEKAMKVGQELSSPYTILETFTKEVFSNNSRADITVKQVVRRFPEIDRDIVIIVSKVEPAEINHKAITGLTYCLQGYALTKCCPASTPDHPLSMLQLCSLISLESSSGVINSPSQARVVSRFLSGNTAANIRCNQERIEGTLVDQSFNAQVRK